MTRGLAAATFAAAAVLTLGACGTTYVDSSVTVAPSVVVTSTLPPVPADAPLDDLLGDIEALMLHLDEQIVDQQDVDATMLQIETLWDVAEAQIRDRDPDDLFPFEQAMDLARSGAERRRPADASKGYKILTAAIDAYPLAD